MKSFVKSSKLNPNAQAFFPEQSQDTSPVSSNASNDSGDKADQMIHHMYPEMFPAKVKKTKKK